MGMEGLLLLLLATIPLSTPFLFSSDLHHRFSGQARSVALSRNGGAPLSWPRPTTLSYYSALLASDLQRQSMKLGAKYHFLFPSDGSQTVASGNDLGWLHYMWIKVGTPGISFFVALDTGSDLFWVPYECMECAPLSAGFFNLDRNLGVYSPSQSSTSKHISCGHELCDVQSSCKSSKLPCPYVVNYYSENTSTSGYLVEDVVHLAFSRTSTSFVNSPVLMGCGRKQTGGYLNGIAPDGLMGLGFANISVPTFLSKMGFARDSFSLCFDEDGSGRIYFGDQGSPLQQSTPFLTSEGKYTTYVVELEGICVASSCPKDTNFRALVDTGSSFTFVPADIYEKITSEFDRHMNTLRFSYEESTWDYCYKASGPPKLPSIDLKFPGHIAFNVQNPIFMVSTNELEVDGFCLAILPTESTIGTIGQNLMTGYRIVFDRENLKLGWSESYCSDIVDEDSVPLTPAPHDKPENPLPTNQKQSSPGGREISPAVASRTPSHHSATTRLSCQGFCNFVIIGVNLLLLPLIF